MLAAGWEIEHKDTPVRLVSIGGSMWSGVRISVHDASNIVGQYALANGSAEQGLCGCLQAQNGNLPGGVTVIPYKERPTNSIDIMVSDEPQP